MIILLTACQSSHVCSYANATCETAEKCECGKTQGEPLGHTTKLGVCYRCGTFNNDYQNITNAVSDNVTSSADTLLNAVKILYYKSSISSISSQDINEFITEINYSKNQLNIAIHSCENINELRTLTEYIKNMKNALDSISGTTVETYIESLNKQLVIHDKYARKATDLLLEWSKSALAESFNN